MDSHALGLRSRRGRERLEHALYVDVGLILTMASRDPQAKNEKSESERLGSYRSKPRRN